MTRLLTAAFLGESEEVENGDFKGHPFRGNQWGYDRGRSREGEAGGRKTDGFGRVPSGDGENLSPKDNLDRAKKAITWAINSGQAVEGVAWRKELGRIDLPAGRVGVIANDYKHGEGIAHMVAKHPEDIEQLARTIALGKVGAAYEPDGRQNPEKRTVRHKNYFGVVVKKQGEKNSWILTHYHAPKK